MGMGKLEQVTNFYYNKLTDILIMYMIMFIKIKM